MPRARSFPLTLRNRYGKVSIYRTRNGTYTSYKIVWQEGSTRKKESRSEETTAVDRANEILADLAANGTSRPDASAAQWAYYRRCESLLPDGVPLIKAVEWFVKHGLKQPVSNPMPVWEVTELFIQAKKDSGRSARYLRTLHYDLEKVALALVKPIADVSVNELDALLRTVDNPRTRKNLRSSVISCWRWAKSKGWLPRDRETAADLTDNPEVKASDPGVITPKDLEATLRQAENTVSGQKIIPYLAIAAFAGVRSAEICRMTWEKHVNLDTGLLILGSDITKTKRRRVIHMEPVLLNWLKAYPGQGKVVPVSRPHASLAQLKDTPWPHNALRHSAVSYLMALHRNAALVAEQCGHTEAQLQANYKAAVTPDQALPWFNIQPNPKSCLATPTPRRAASA